ncbi:hypothetical protein [Lachnoclostridium phytofermentans]|uniref:Uncharacterized protein n=1 Tax=Lachnoclostridium phytofermentans (strain ATCC 700394 / DSM 18823 / ISDg) TaxID=357809 RepID=A9KQ28_LACP7|nr:hypothetical protein [Lachnoclostridium phytofermentans]ABX43340.1 hypothetical protein Cphy_2983 [Lachnoclostridium phytofermentans ISDg]
MNSVLKTYTPSDQEVKGIWADTYKLFLQYKDVDCSEYENEINLACETIGQNYENCEISALLVTAVLRTLIDRSETYKSLIKNRGEFDGRNGK